MWPTLLAADRAGWLLLAEEPIDLLECRLGSQPGEDLAGRSEGRCRLRCAAERQEAATTAQERVRFLIGHAEAAPARGGGGEVGRRRCVFGSPLAKRSMNARHNVLLQRESRRRQQRVESLDDAGSQSVATAAQDRSDRLRDDLQYGDGGARRCEALREQAERRFALACLADAPPPRPPVQGP